MTTITEAMDAIIETIKNMERIEIVEMKKIAMISREVLDTQRIGMKSFKIRNEKKGSRSHHSI